MKPCMQQDSNLDALCTEDGLQRIVDALLLLHEHDNRSKACTFVIAGSFAAKLQANIAGASPDLIAKLRFNDVDVFYAHEWTPCSVTLPDADHIETGFIDCYYRDLVFAESSDERPVLAIVPPADEDASVERNKLTDVNFVRRYDYDGFAGLDVEDFVHRCIDINAVKVGVKVTADATGRVEVVWTQNADFAAFISETPAGVLGVLRVPDLRLTTHPANSILRLLVKANAMGLAFALPGHEELVKLSADGVLCRMMLMEYHMAAWKALPAKLKRELECLGLVFVPADSGKAGIGERLMEMKFV